jgi:hypothetical protein
MGSQKRLFEGVSQISTVSDHLCTNNTFVRVVEIHGIQTNGGDLVGNDFNSKVCSSLENLQVRERDELAPYAGG